MNPESWQRAGHSLRHNGHEIFYRDDGEGTQALLLIHGFPTSSWDWAPMWAGLRQRFARVIAPDMLGFGFSDKPAQHRYSMLEQTDLIEAVLKHCGVDRVHVLAHDYGVSIAQELLARQLEGRGPALDSVCLLNGGLFPETHRLTLMQRVLRSPLGFIVARLSSERRFGSSFSHVFGPNTRPSLIELHDFWTLVSHKNGARILHKLIRYIRDRRENRERWVGALQKTAVPLRLINGPLDPVSGAHMVARYRELVPKPDVVMLDGIGHYPQVEAPQAVLRAFFEFQESIA